MSKPLVTVITATTGKPSLRKCVESVKKQTYGNVQHLIFVDGEEATERLENDFLTMAAIRDAKCEVVNLPYSIGKDRWNGHRMYGAGTYIADGDFVTFLDDDNTLDPEHIQNCYYAYTSNPAAIKWSYSLRKIVNVEGDFLCNDDCESLGNWASVCGATDFFIDVNCYFLPKTLAIYVTPIWYRKFREPGQPEVDRMLCANLRNIVPGICTKQYSVNYAVASNAALSVKPEFFVNGNAEMRRRYGGALPWTI